VWLDLMKVQSVAAVMINCAMLWKFKSQVFQFKLLASDLRVHLRSWLWGRNRLTFFSGGQGINSLVPTAVMNFFATINCAVISAQVDGSGSLENSDSQCDHKVLYQTLVAVMVVEHLMVIVKVSLGSVFGAEPSHIADDEFTENYFAEKEAFEYDAQLQRLSQRYSARKAIAELNEEHDPTRELPSE